MCNMRPKLLFGLLIPLACAALFVRLGFWQVSRHRERAAYNARVAARLAATPVPFPALSPDTALVRGQRVTLAGRFRYDREQVLAGRANDGQPSVHLITPLERPGTDTLVAVTRGWVYSPDAAEVDRPRWHEGDSVTLSGYALPLPADGPLPPADTLKPLRSLNVAALSRRLGRPVAPAVVVMTSDSTVRPDSVPRRLGPPTLGPGNHKSYAIQWFAFAAIAVAGGVLLFRRSVVTARTAL
jgi:surfeit locus 1 family protein